MPFPIATLKTTALSSHHLIGRVEDITTLVGVIDLKNGAAVHAVQGKRDRYQPVDFCSGDPVLLLEHYVRLGIRRFYVADLDAISHDQPSADVIERLAANCETDCDSIEIIFDLGWRGRDRNISGKLTQRLSGQFRRCHWIAATESMPNPKAISELAQVVGADRTILSLDYRRGRLLGENHNQQEWLMAAINSGVNRLLVLDLASVGSSEGPTTVQTCKTFSSIQVDSQTRFDPQIYSGGGIRSPSDIETLNDAGCSHFLLATALYPQGNPACRNF